MATEFDPKKRWLKSPIFRISGQKNYYYPDERLTPNVSEELSNMNLTERGSSRTNHGSAKYNSNQITESTVAKSVTGLHQQTYKDGTELEIEVAGTKVYTNDGTTRTDVTDTLTLTNSVDSRYRFAFLKDQVVATNGVDETWVKGGSGNASALSGVPWTTCEDLVTHRNLLFALGTTESGTKHPTRIRWNDIDTTTHEIDITSWPTGNRYAVFEDGAPIVGGVDAFGRLIVVKGDGLYPITVRVEQGFVEAFSDNPLRGGFSPIAKSSIVTNPSFGIFLVAKDGAYVIRPDMSFELVTRDIQTDWNGLNQSRLVYAQSWIRETDHQVRTLMSSSSNTAGHDKVLVYDWETGDVWFDTPNDARGFSASFRQSNVEYDYVGTTDGYTLQANDPAQAQDNGTDITWTLRPTPNDLQQPGVDKEIGNIITYYIDKPGSDSITFNLYRNERRLPKRTGTLSIGTSQTYDSGLTYDSGVTFGGDVPQNIPFFVNRFSETVQPEWTGTADMEIVGYQVEYRTAE